MSRPATKNNARARRNGDAIITIVKSAGFMFVFCVEMACEWLVHASALIRAATIWFLSVFLVKFFYC
jgi:hypothetical protein